MNRSDVEELLCAIAEDRVSDALRAERDLYVSVVKHTDTEGHYRAQFEQWSGAMQDMGRRHAHEPAQGAGVAFFIHSNADLAHVTLLREVLKESDGLSVVFCLVDNADNLRHTLNCVLIPVGSEPQPGFARMHAIMLSRGIGTLVWVSAPLYASYALAARLASRQVYWAMRFHPLSFPEIDGYITNGPRREKSRDYHGQKWAVGHAPMCIEPAPVDIDDAERYRLQFGFPRVIGTVAREEKIANPDYLECVAEVLKANPDTLFIWTGKKERADIRTFFLEMGLARQNRFVGWADPDKFLALLDVFLETFPQGGTMTWLAMAHGIPVVGLAHPQAAFGWLDDVPPGAGRAENHRQYVDLACAFLSSPARAKAAVEAGWTIYKSERAACAADCRRIWSLIRG